MARAAKSIWRCGHLRFLHLLIDFLKEERPSRFEDFRFIALPDFDFGFLRPISKVCDVRTIMKTRSEAAAPAYKIFRLRGTRRRRSIEQRRCIL